MTTSTCRAVVFAGDGTFQIRDFPLPALPAAGAILQVEAVGMCGSDLGALRGVNNTGRGRYPVVPGHEIVGRIFRITDEAAASWQVKAGDRVAVDEIVRTGQGRVVYGKDFVADASSGLFGGFAEYMVLLPETKVYPITDDLPASELTIFEGLANAVAWTRHVRAGGTVVIQGPGHIGLACVCAAREAGAATVIVTGTAADSLRLETALRIGATHTIDVDKADPVQEVARLTGGALADVVIDAASGSTRTQGWALQMAKAGGDIVVGGLNEFAAIDGFVSDWIPMRQLTIHPSGGLQFQAAVDLINAGRIPTADLLGEVFTLDQFQDALSLLGRSTPGRDAVRVSLSLVNEPQPAG
jgi:threonine dehydrogenase-like Zn-dependent dehydrogenase